MSDETQPKDSFEATQARHFAQCVKEAKFCASVWIVAWIVCATVAWKFGYLPPDQRPDDPWLMLGMPGWVAFGVFLPWLALISITIWFASKYLKDDEPCHKFPGQAEREERAKEASDA